MPCNQVAFIDAVRANTSRGQLRMPAAEARWQGEGENGAQFVQTIQTTAMAALEVGMLVGAGVGKSIPCYGVETPHPIQLASELPGSQGNLGASQRSGQSQKDVQHDDTRRRGAFSPAPFSRARVGVPLEVFARGRRSDVLDTKCNSVSICTEAPLVIRLPKAGFHATCFSGSRVSIQASRNRAGG